MLSEVGLFLLALIAVLMAFASSISALRHNQPDFKGIHHGALTLLEMTLRMYDGKHYEMYESDPQLLVFVGIFLFIVVAFLLNMLVAQLTCAYEALHVDMVGYARLDRIDVVVNSMSSVTESRWRTFFNYMKLGEKIEFGAGDVGLAGGIQILEPVNLNPTTQDMIRRFGGSTSVEMQWPAEADDTNDDAGKFDRIEALIQRTLKRIARSGGGKGGGSSGSGSSLNSHTVGRQDEGRAVASLQEDHDGSEDSNTDSNKEGAGA